MVSAERSRPKNRWFRATPERLVVLLAAVVVTLWASDWLCSPFLHKGYAVLTASAAVAATILSLFLWFVVSVVFGLRFQYSLRSLFILVFVVALMCSWFSMETARAIGERELIGAICARGGAFPTITSGLERATMRLCPGTRPGRPSQCGFDASRETSFLRRLSTPTSRRARHWDGSANSVSLGIWTSSGAASRTWTSIASLNCRAWRDYHSAAHGLPTQACEGSNDSSN